VQFSCITVIDFTARLLDLKIEINIVSLIKR